MDRQKQRKGHENRKFPNNGNDFFKNEKDTYNDKSKYKRQSNKIKYDMNPKTYATTWSPQARFHPLTHRQNSISESSVCHYSVPLGFTFEPVSLPIYPAVIQPQGTCPVPFERDHIDMSKSYKKHKNRYGVSRASSVVQSHSPAIFHTPKLNNGDQQDYASLPPVNCDIYTAKSSDTEAICKRRFSDPGIGPMSSDDCSSTRSDDSNQTSSASEAHSNDFFMLVEQINELKESNSQLKKELNETKVELEVFKMQSLTWKTGSEEFKPGALSDAISEIRNAVKISEEALVSKVIQMLEKNSIECKESQENLRLEMNEKLSKLEEEINKSSQRHAEKPETVEPPPQNKEPDVQQQISELEREILQLRKELQEAVAKRKSAEATTEKLERLVGILRKKINGVSLESCITDDKHILVRPLTSSLEKNPFIIANNKQIQKSDGLPFSKPKIPPYRGFLMENTEGTVPTDNKENENGESGTGNGDHPPSEASSVTAQVTITGPVTDL